jgi:HrpA-like RNA helicase
MRTAPPKVPQLLLDDAILHGRGALLNIICTQPRRLSAIGVASRVAEERCERVGETIGYNIRLEKVRDNFGCDVCNR